MKIVKGMRRSLTGKSDSCLSGEVAKLAYQLYCQKGRNHGHDMDDWLKAEKIVKSRCKPR